MFALFHPQALIAAEEAARIQLREHQQGCIEGGRQPVVRPTITLSRRAIRLARWKEPARSCSTLPGALLWANSSTRTNWGRRSGTAGAFAAAVGFEQADHHIGAVSEPFVAFLQQATGLAHPRRRAHESGARTGSGKRCGRTRDGGPEGICRLRCSGGLGRHPVCGSRRLRWGFRFPGTGCALVPMQTRIPPE